MGRKTKTKFVLSAEERAQLEALLRRRTIEHALVVRARIVLESACGAENKAVAAKLGITTQTVLKWCKRFAQGRLDGLHDAPHTGMPPRIVQAHIDAVIARTLGKASPNGMHWTTRALAREMNMSQSSISRIWHAAGLRPDRQVAFRLSTDAQFVERMRDIVGFYLDPPIKTLVLCSAHIPSDQPPKYSARQAEHKEPVNYAGMHLFAKLDSAIHEASGRRKGRTDRLAFLQFLRAIDAATPADLDVNLVMDNPGQDQGVRVMTWLIRHPRFRIHWASSSAAWLNEVRNCFQTLTDQQVAQRLPRSTRSLLEAIRHYLKPKRAKVLTFAWNKNAAELGIALRHFRNRYLDSVHKVSH